MKVLKYKQSNGAALPLYAIAMVMLLLIVGLAIDGSLFFRNITQIQSLSDQAALAALKTFTRNDSVPVPPPSGTPTPVPAYRTLDQRKSDALLAARMIFQSNKITNVSSTNFDATHSIVLPGGSETTSTYLKVELGKWLTKTPANSLKDPPCEKYPCFLAYQSTTDTDKISAIRVSVNIPSSALKFGFFSSLWEYVYGGKNKGGASILTLKGSGVAAVQERCVAMLLDVSRSAVSESHNYSINQNLIAGSSPLPARYMMAPWNPAMYSFRYSSIKDAAGANKINCSDPVSEMSAGLDSAYWCNLGIKHTCPNAAGTVCSCGGNTDGPRSGPGDTPSDGDCIDLQSLGTTRPATYTEYPNKPMAKVHFQSDYFPVVTGRGKVLIDYFSYPQPLSSFLSGMNAGLRELGDVSSANDQAMLFGFDSIARAKITTFDDDDTTPIIPQGVSQKRDLGYLLQVTNVDNIGKITQVGSTSTVAPVNHPNFLDYGLFPLFAEPNSGTNILYAFQKAIDFLVDENKCPVNAKKIIIVATDGKISAGTGRTPAEITQEVNQFGCVFDSVYSGNCRQPPPARSYIKAENALISDFFSGTVNDPSNGMLGELLNANIQVTSLIAGRQVHPHYLNIRNSNGVGGWLDPILASALGYSGFGPSNKRYFSADQFSYTYPMGYYYYGPHAPITRYTDDQALQNCRNASTEVDPWLDCSWQLSGSINGNEFRRANNVMGELSLRTGGVFCPIIPLVGSYECYKYYDHDGDEHSTCTDSGDASTGAWSYDPFSTPRILADDFRGGDGGMLAYSPYLETTASQAAKCVRDAIGAQPYYLVSEDPAS
jgi:hypothetical protein